jgi:ATP synthase I chain
MKIIKLLSSEDKCILKVSCITAIIISIITIIPAFFLNWWKWTFFLSILIGYLASVICYFKLVYVVFRETSLPTNQSKRAFIFNNLSNLLIYCVALMICFFVGCLNIFLCFLGMMIIKIIIIILYGRQQKVGEKKNDR